MNPSTLYPWRDRHRADCSPDCTFRTAMSTGDSFRFIAYGDNRGGTETPPQFRQEHFEVVNSMLVHAWSESEPRPRFILHVGDFLHDGGVVGQWRPQFFHPAAGLLRSTPLWPSIGNHEYEGDDDASNYRDLFSVPEVPDKPENYPQEYWYSFDYANCHFIVLDTGLDADVDYIYGTEEDPSDQYQWLVDDISSADNADWVIVLLHIPPYTDSSSHPYGSQQQPSDVYRVRTYLAPIFEDEDHPADLVISGHNHFYERSQARETEQSNHWVHYIVTGGGGAPTHTPGGNNPQRVLAYEAHHFCIIDIDGTTATLNVIEKDGTPIEEDVVLVVGEEWEEP